MELLIADGRPGFRDRGVAALMRAGETRESTMLLRQHVPTYPATGTEPRGGLQRW